MARSDGAVRLPFCAIHSSKQVDGMTLDSIAAIAATGVDYASSGALTHSAPALDVGLDIAM
jgi:nicotinate-nucleotide pyrophosphorylase